MALKLSLADFITLNHDGEFVKSDCTTDALNRFMTKDEKAVREELRSDRTGKGRHRVKLFLTPACKLRCTQKGIVPLNDLKSQNAPTSSMKTILIPWLLKMLNDEETHEQVIAYIEEKFDDVFFSSDKCGRVCQRLEDPDDIIHDDPDVAIKTFFAMCNAMNPSIATEGKCDIVRATEDGIIAEFNPLPEHLTVGRARGKFYKMFPTSSDNVPINAIKALVYLSNRDLLVYHGRKHIRSVPFHEISNTVFGMSNKSKEELQRIKNDPLCAAAGEKSVALVDMLLAGEKTNEIIKRLSQRSAK
nr:NSP2 [Rotavirus I]